MTPVAVGAILGMQLLLSPQTGARAEPVSANPDTLRVPDAIDAKARELVRQLGDRDYDDREDAQKELRELGRLALPALADGYEKSPVPEVAERCDQLLPRARALDIRARVDCFAADADGKYEHHLPGAKEFFAITGRTDKARALYRDMLLSSNRGLISGIGGSETELAQQAVNRRIELYPRSVVVGGSVQRPTPPTALDIAALLFVESTIPEKLLTEAGTAGGVAVSSPSVLLSQPAFRTALTSDDQKEAMTAITVKWCETREELRTIYSCMSVAASLKLPVSITLAKKVLSMKGATPLYKVQAACNVAKVGKPEDAALIAPLLTDETQATVGVVAIVNGVQQRSPVQVRDVALAMTLLMNQQDPVTFGMKSRYAANATNETLKFNYLNYYFDDTESKAEESRKAAFKKWDELKAKVPKK